MSDIAEEDPWSALNANSVDMCAAEWCERRGQAGWSEGDQAEFDTWLAASPAHTVAYLRMHHVWKRADRLAALKQPVPEPAPPVQRKPNLARWAGAILIAIGVMGAAAGVFLRSAHEDKYATPVGGHRIVVLADGSQLELNTDTQLRVIANAQRRVVLLNKGEAFFQIKHDASRPFVVMSDGRRIVDLGTKFLVRREADQLRVSVLEGRVRLETGAHTKPAVLLAGDVAVAAGNSVTVAKQPGAELSGALGWRRGQLIFTHMSLAAATQEFNRYNREKLVVADAATAHLTIDGTFPANNPGAFTRLAKAIFGLRVTKGEDEVVISR